MSKILYIEDEITKNIATIKTFFKTLMKGNEKVLKRLTEIEENNALNNADNIIDACKEISKLEICYSFPEAIKKITNESHKYELFIIDRNLYSRKYHAEIPNILEILKESGIGDAQSIVDGHMEREGDILAFLLFIKNHDNLCKIFFLTAHPYIPEGIHKLDHFIDTKQFSIERVIIKGSEAEGKIIKAINDSESMNIENQYLLQCSILRFELGEEMVDKFIDMIRYHSSDKRSEFLFLLRNLCENILHSLAFGMGEYNADYWNSEKTQLLKIMQFINGRYYQGKVVEGSGLPAYNLKKNISYNSIIRNALASIYDITSECGVHSLSKGVNISNANIANISIYTMQSLLAQICEVIVWYDKAMEIIQ